MAFTLNYDNAYMQNKVENTADASVEFKSGDNSNGVVVYARIAFAGIKIVMTIEVQNRTNEGKLLDGEWFKYQVIDGDDRFVTEEFALTSANGANFRIPIPLGTNEELIRLSFSGTDGDAIDLNIDPRSA